MLILHFFLLLWGVRMAAFQMENILNHSHWLTVKRDFRKLLKTDILFYC